MLSTGSRFGTKASEVLFSIRGEAGVERKREMLLLIISFSGERPPHRHSPLRVGLLFKVQSANEDFCRTSAQRRSREDETASCGVTTFNI